MARQVPSKDDHWMSGWLLNQSTEGGKGSGETGSGFASPGQTGTRLASSGQAGHRLTHPRLIDRSAGWLLGGRDAG